MHPSAEVFGQLYIVVFDNGTVKAGMSISDCATRIKSHAHAGRAFGISKASEHIAIIYSDDVRRRESLMHKHLAEVAALTSGREWFKFESMDDAEKFSKNYAAHVQKMSYAERPPAVALSTKKSKRSQAIDVAIETLRTIGTKQLAGREIDEAKHVLKSMPDNVVIMLAQRVVELEDVASLNAENCDHGMPLLRCAVDEFLGSPDGRMSIDVARRIVESSMQYRDFFMAAFQPKENEAEQ